MIDQIFKLDRPLIVYDTETTGVNTDTDRIAEVGFQDWRPDKPVREWRTLIRTGVPMPQSAADVHKITEAEFNNCSVCKLPLTDHADQVPAEGHEGLFPGSLLPYPHPFKLWPTFKQIAPSLAKGFSNCDFAGKNIRFDLRITAAEMQRAGVQWSYLGARIIDADRLEQIGEPRHLSNLYEKHTGKKLEGAHAALVDVRATTEVIVAQMRKYASVLPYDLDQLHKLQWPEQYLDGKGQFKLINGVPTCTFGKHKGKPMKDVPVGYYDWILRPDVDMPADVKALAANAKIGIFPEG
jgi:DNA polymerase-3 subunit epsilon